VSGKWDLPYPGLTAPDGLTKLYQAHIRFEVWTNFPAMLNGFNYTVPFYSIRMSHVTGPQIYEFFVRAPSDVRILRKSHENRWKKGEKKNRIFRRRTRGGRELNKFDLGDGDFAILGLKMSKKRKNLEPGKCRTSICSNFLMIAEK
jgi:hypothetical protein